MDLGKIPLCSNVDGTDFLRDGQDISSKGQPISARDSDSQPMG